MTNITLAESDQQGVLISLSSALQELLAEVSHKDDNKTVGQKLWRLMVHALAWAICIGSTTASVFSVYHFSEYMHQVRFLQFVKSWLPETLKWMLIQPELSYWNY